jgi:hypothetical protein
MRCLSNLCILAVVVFVAATSVPAFSQQAKGDSELGLNGSFSVPHSSPGDVSGTAAINYGYYFKGHDLVGADILAILNKDFKDVFVQGRYRHLFSTGNPKIYPFLGAAGGINILSASGSSTAHNALGTAEAGMKFFVSQKTAFELAYNFQYIHISGGSFTDNSQSVITFGFTHLFGGHR